MKNNEWLERELGWIVEVDLTLRCNLACRHCNRLCNSEKQYNVKREMFDMKEIHIDFLISEIKKHPIGKVNMIRVLGGEPLLLYIPIHLGFFVKVGE